MPLGRSVDAIRPGSRSGIRWFSIPAEPVRKPRARAWIPTIGVLTGGFSRKEPRDAGAAVVFDSIRELRRRLDDTPLA